MSDTNSKNNLNNNNDNSAIIAKGNDNSLATSSSCVSEGNKNILYEFNLNKTSEQRNIASNKIEIYDQQVSIKKKILPTITMNKNTIANLPSIQKKKEFLNLKKFLFQKQIYLILI